MDKCGRQTKYHVWFDSIDGSWIISEWISDHCYLFKWWNVPRIRSNAFRWHKCCDTKKKNCITSDGKYICYGDGVTENDNNEITATKFNKKQKQKTTTLSLSVRMDGRNTKCAFSCACIELVAFCSQDNCRNHLLLSIKKWELTTTTNDENWWQTVCQYINNIERVYDKLIRPAYYLID